MTITQESDLVETVAFLTASNDDPLKVTAVCVELHHARGGLTFRMAANSGDLSQVVKSLTKMARILERVAKKGACSMLASSSSALPDDLNCRSYMAGGTLSDCSVPPSHRPEP